MSAPPHEQARELETPRGAEETLAAAGPGPGSYEDPGDHDTDHHREEQDEWIEPWSAGREEYRAPQQKADDERPVQQPQPAEPSPGCRVVDGRGGRHRTIPLRPRDERPELQDAARGS